MWPEEQVFYFYTVLGKSSDWGTSPWNRYFTSALPKSVLLTILLVPMAMLRIPERLAFMERQRKTKISSSSSQMPAAASLLDVTWLSFLAPILGFVILCPFLGRKEIEHDVNDFGHFTH